MPASHPQQARPREALSWCPAAVRDARSIHFCSPSLISPGGGVQFADKGTEAQGDASTWAAALSVGAGPGVLKPGAFWLPDPRFYHLCRLPWFRRRETSQELGAPGG